MTFEEWLRSRGCTVLIEQEDDGSGYYCLSVETPEGIGYDITVTTG